MDKCQCGCGKNVTRDGNMFLIGHCHRGKKKRKYITPNLPKPSEPNLCRCGCGAHTNIIGRTNNKAGLVKGQYRDYINGHSSIGKKNSKDHMAKHVKTKTGKDPVYSPFLEDTIVSYKKDQKRWCCMVHADTERGMKWKQVNHARVVYEHYYGPVPKGFHIHHKNGDASKLENDSPDNLIAIPKDWNLKCIPVLSFGFGVSQLVVTDIYCELVTKVLPCDLFAEICGRLIELRRK